jgi:SulP family sulfate permease
LSKKDLIPVNLETLGDKFGDITFKIFESYSWSFSFGMLKVASVIALIAILETMLSAKIADGMTKTKHNQRREMLGLGFANIVSGLVGGMPATAALARTSLNIKSGATHNSSGIINAIGVAVICIFLLGYFRYIPMSVIAAILVFVAVQMVQAEHYLKYWKYERSGFFVSIIVALVTFLEDPIMGILLGVAISLLLFVNRMSHGQFDLKLNKFNEGMVGNTSGEYMKEIEENADVLLYSIKGKLCYINSRAHVVRFEENLSKYKHIIIRLKEVYFMDTDGVEALDEIISIIESRGQQALITGIEPPIIGLLEQTSHTYKKLKSENLVFSKSEQALNYLGIPTRKYTN